MRLYKTRQEIEQLRRERDERAEALEQQLAEARAQGMREAAEIAQNFSDDRLCERIAGAIERAAEPQQEHEQTPSTRREK